MASFLLEGPKALGSARYRCQSRGILLAACLLALSPATGQWLETTIYLPDSLSGVIRPACIVHNTTNNKLYVSGLFEPYGGPNPAYRWAVVIDGSTDRRIGRIKVGERAAMLYNPTGNKLYVQHGACVSVFDAAKDTMVASIQMPDAPEAFCLNTMRNKLYCGSEIGELTVVDCSSDTVVGRIPMADGTLGMCYNPVSDKLYATPSRTGWPDGERKTRAGRPESTLCIIDACSDSVLTTIPLSGDVLALCHNPIVNKVYCRTDMDTLVVIDGAADSVVARVFVGWGYARGALSLNPGRNKLYCSNVDDGTVAVIDCATDSVIARVELGLGYEAEMLCYNAVDDKVYCTDRFEGVVAVIDCGRDSVLTRLLVGDEPCALCYNPVSNRVYCVNLESDDVTVIDGVGDSVSTTVAVGARPESMCYDSRDNKVYCASESNDQLMVIDGATNEVVGTVNGIRRCKAVCYSPVQNKVYCTVSGKLGIEPRGDTLVAVVDCAGDTVVRYLRVDRNPLVLGYNPVYDKMYVASSSPLGASIAIVDCRSDSVRAVLRQPDGNHPAGFCYNTTGNKMYVSGQAIWVIDGVADTLLDSILLHSLIPVTSLCYAERQNKIYADGAMGYVICGYGDTVMAMLGRGLNTPCYNPIENKVYYILFGEYVSVFDCWGDTTLAVARVGYRASSFAYNALNNKIHCGCDCAVYVLDGATNLVLCSIPAGRSAITRTWNPVENRVYVANYWGSSVTVIRDSVPQGVEDTVTDGRGTSHPWPTLVHGILILPQSPTLGPLAPFCLLDAAGRKVADLTPGQNDVRGLPTGVYFVRAADGRVGKKVIVAR